MSHAARAATAAAAWIVGGLIVAALVMWPLGAMLVIAVGFAGAGVIGVLFLLVVITLEWVRGAQKERADV